MRTISALLAAATLAACAAARPPATPVAAPPVAAAVVDLTHAFDADTIYWPTDTQGFVLETVAEGMTEGGWYYAAHRFSTAEHGGTHLDAPVHFAAGGWTADEIPVERLIGPAVVVDVTAAAAADRDYEVGIADFERWEAAHGRLPAGAIVLLRTGYGRFWPDRAAYLGTDRRGPEAIPELHFPGLGPKAARWLVAERSIDAIGLDTPSIDRGQSTTFESHRILFAANVPAFENVARLDALPAAGFTVVALPMKIRGGSGGPLRIVALVPEGE
jgi:kynurenine formamidase